MAARDDRNMGGSGAAHGSIGERGKMKNGVSNH